MLDTSRDINLRVMFDIFRQRRVAAHRGSDHVDQQRADDRHDDRYQRRSEEGKREQRVCLAGVALTLRDRDADRSADTEKEEHRLHKEHHGLGEVDGGKGVVVDQSGNDDPVYKGGEKDRHGADDRREKVFIELSAEQNRISLQRHHASPSVSKKPKPSSAEIKLLI